MRPLLLSLLFTLLLSACGGQQPPATEQPAPATPQAATGPATLEQVPGYVRRAVKDEYGFVRDSITEAIGDRGIKINNISHIGDMLSRTAADVGASKTVYLHAEAIEFCSATISRGTMEADPHNITFCPYIIAVYETPEQPGVIYVAYRKPLLVGDEASRQALKAVGDLLDSIVDTALADYSDS